jgi:hypothetical protein
MKKKLVHRAMYLEDALLALMEMERTASELESSDVFQTFTTSEKEQYRDVLSRLRDLIHDLEQDSVQEQLASCCGITASMLIMCRAVLVFLKNLDFGSQPLCAS